MHQNRSNWIDAQESANLAFSLLRRSDLVVWYAYSFKGVWCVGCCSATEWLTFEKLLNAVQISKPDLLTLEILACPVIVTGHAAASVSVAAAAAGPREAHPVGNTGGTSQIPQTGRGVLAPVLVGFNHG